MDTTTVNYAIDKLNEALQTIKPTAMKLGGEYIGYTVLKITIFPFIWATLLAIALVVVLTAVKSYKNSSRSYTSDSEFARFAIGGVAVTASFIALVVSAYSAILANAFPLMYTIEQLAK